MLKPKALVCPQCRRVINTGITRVGYRTWRSFEASADPKWATLSAADGSVYGLVSFGTDTYPSGACEQADIAPGETITDILLFICKAKPASDLKLTLPCENIGGKGVIRFTIPRGLIR